MNIPVFAIVDTNSDPTQVDYPIPANDDAWKSISLILKTFGKAIEEGLQERKQEKDEAKMKEAEEEKKAVDTKAEEAPSKEEAKDAK